MEQLKSCSEIASARPASWQRLCAGDDSVLVWLVWAATSLDTGVAPTLLTLLQCALCNPPTPSSSKDGGKEKEKEKGSKKKEKKSSEQAPPPPPTPSEGNEWLMF